MRKHLPFLLVSCFALGMACTNDYDQFSMGDGDESDASAGASGQATGGTAGSPTGGTGGTGGTSTGGTGGGPTGGTGGGPTGGTGADPTGGTGADPTGGTGADPTGGTGGGPTGGTGGGPTGGTGGSPTGGTGGSPTGGTGGSPTGGTGGTPTCGQTEKYCAPTCVPLDDPQTGCANLASCDPCDFPHASAICNNGACAIGNCASGYGDCTGAPGCETEIASNTQNCGQCSRVCSSVHVDTLACEAGLCTSSCEAGWGNCVMPATGNDDGCETDLATAAGHCGACENACRPNWTCKDGGCRCNGNTSCRVNTITTGTCRDDGRCQCGGGPGAQPCRPGEHCERFNTQVRCSCNGGAACPQTDGVVCCQNPPGCFNLDTDEEHCGACGFKCAPGETCSNGTCS